MTVVVVIVLMAALFIYALKVMKKRSAAFARAAEGMGYTYSLHDSPFKDTDVAGLSLLTDTRYHRYRDVLVAKAGSPVVISELQYGLHPFAHKDQSGSVTSDSEQNHSAIAYRLQRGSLPIFQVFSRGVFGNMGIPLGKEAFRGLSGAAGIDLGNEEFAKRYVVVAEDSSAVRMLFSPFLVRAFLDQPPHTWLHVQVSPDWLFFYDPAFMILAPEAIAPALARVQPIADMMMGTAPAPAA